MTRPLVQVVLALALLPSCRYAPHPGEPVQARAAAPPLQGSWHLPQIDPCAMVERAEMAALVGIPVESGPGGTVIDGSACRYVGPGPFVVTVGFVSTNAYESLRLDVGEPVPDVGVSAVAVGPDALGDVTLAARGADAAVLVRVSGAIPGGEGPTRRALAATIARRALERLKHTTIATRRTRQTSASRPATTSQDL